MTDWQRLCVIGQRSDREGLQKEIMTSSTKYVSPSWHNSSCCEACAWCTGLGWFLAYKRCTLLSAPLATTFFSRWFSQALLRCFHSNINRWLTKLLRHFQSSSVDFEENCTYKYPAIKQWQWILKGKVCFELLVSQAWSTPTEKWIHSQDKPSSMSAISQGKNKF